MKKCKHIRALAVITCFVCGLFSSVIVLAQGGVTVSISAPTQVALGTDFMAMVNIGNLMNFNAANYDVRFNPAVLQVGNVTSGLVSGTIVPVDMWSVITPGILRVIQNVPGLSGVSGSGYLSQIRFHVIGSGGNTSQINLANGVLSDNSANQILANWVGDTVNVYAQTSTPTPTPTPTPTATPSPTSTPTPIPIVTPTSTPAVTSPGGGGAGGSGGQMPSMTPGPTPTLPAMPTVTASAEVTPTPAGVPIPTVTPTPVRVYLSFSTSTPLDLSGVIDKDGVTQCQLAITCADAGAEMEICQGATALTVNGESLRAMSVRGVAVAPAPPADSYIIGLAYDFEPTGATFNPPMTLILQYDPALCPEGTTQEDLGIAYYDAQSGKWVQLVSSVDTTSYTVTAQVGHLNLVAILVKASQAPNVSNVNESLVGGITAGVIVIGVGAYYLVRRKRSTRSS